MDRGAWRVSIREVAKSWTQLGDSAHIMCPYYEWYNSQSHNFEFGVHFNIEFICYLLSDVVSYN